MVILWRLFFSLVEFLDFAMIFTNFFYDLHALNTFSESDLFHSIFFLHTHTVLVTLNAIAFPCLNNSCGPCKDMCQGRDLFWE